MKNIIKLKARINSTLRRVPFKYTMRDYKKMKKDRLLKALSGYRGTIITSQNTYIEIIAEINYLRRRNKLVEERLEHFEKLYGKRTYNSRRKNEKTKNS